MRRVVFRQPGASVPIEVSRHREPVLEETIQAGELSEGLETRSTSPFEDIAAVHALYQRRIYRFLLLSLRDQDAAHSLTQDTFLNAWRYRKSFRGECSIATWLMRIAVNLLRDHTRTETFRFWKKAASTAVDADDLKTHLPHPTRSAESALLAQEKLGQVWKRVQKLSDKQRTVFLLRFVEEMDLQQIAISTGMPLPTVKSHLYRALDHVRGNAHSTKGDRI